jgi:hypothetical protein
MITTIQPYPQWLLLLILWAMSCKDIMVTKNTLLLSLELTTIYPPPSASTAIPTNIHPNHHHLCVFFCVQMSSMLHHEAEAPYVSSPQHWYYRIPMTYHPKVVSPKRWDGFDLLESPPFLEVPALRQGLDFRVQSWRPVYALLEFWWRSTIIIFLVVV